MNAIRVWWENRFLAELEARERKRAQRMPSWRTRQRRRALVAVLVIAELAIVVGPLAVWPRQLDAASLSLVFVPLVAVAVAHSLLRTLTGRMSSGFSSLLDERERKLRNRASHIGYHVLGCLMLVEIVYLLVMRNQPEVATQGAVLLGALVLIGGTAPMVVLGWQLPDDEVEDGH
ncbi:DUF2178 domain-containing protein [Amycolatopsis taiwanensis]|uniref:DUF2178 domain-containing protein n=1 Tax=Amycolatopsis taiwanensis TaxID=342230 RepID=UPI000486DE59|nr:DUF2178 domain-containing protein [Amycolatopsis taiwanensis]